MEARGARKRWPYSEYARLPESGSTRYEIIDDELVVTPSPSGRHQAIVTRLGSLLHVFTQERQLGKAYVGPLDVLFDEGDYLQPDVLFVSSARTDLVSDRGVEGPPDLVIEVLSPSTAARDRGIKLDRYRTYGVPEVWLVDPDERTIEVCRLGRGASQAERYGGADALQWTPEAGGPTLSFRVSGVFDSEAHG